MHEATHPDTTSGDSDAASGASNAISEGSPAASELSKNVRRARYSRADHRARQHKSAHSEDPADLPGQVIEHRRVPGGEAALVTTPQQLEALLADLRAAGSFAYDSEFIGELTYVPKLCLIQVATTAQVALIDPLVGLDLKPFWELICDESVEKIVHAGQQDVEPVIRHLGREARNVFDTQIAAGFVGMAYPVALSKLVSEIVGAKLGKGLTFTHWDQRPLSSMQLRYAADDVRYLPALREELGRRLEANGHTAWAREECAAMCDARLYTFDADTAFHRVRGATSLQPAALAVLRELVVWRDATARAHDVPPRAFLKDDILIDLSRNPVKTIEKLDRVRGLPRPVEHAHGREIVEATLRGLATPPDKLPWARHSEPTPTERFRADALWAVAQCMCIGRGVDPNLVTSRQEIGEFHRCVVKGSQHDDIGIMKGWRQEALGEPLAALINGGATVALNWKDGALHSH
jgi:ribonuclease D